MAGLIHERLTIDALTARNKCNESGFSSCFRPRSLTNVTAPLMCLVQTVRESSVDVIASYREKIMMDIKTSSDLASTGSWIDVPISRNALPYNRLASSLSSGDLRPLLRDARANECVARCSTEFDFALTYIGPSISIYPRRLSLDLGMSTIFLKKNATA